MLEFKQDDTAAVLIMTLTELVSLTDPYFLFVFTHITTKDQVIFLKFSDDDESDHPERYNQFTINPAVLFAGKGPGFWQYTVYEQASDTNLDPAAAGGILEWGELIIDRAADFAFTKYDSPTSFKTYNG